MRYHRVAVREDEALTTVLDAAAGGALLDDVAKSLVDKGVSFEEARAYVDEVVDSQLLVPDLGPRITGDDAAADLVARLRAADATRPVADALAAALAATRALDARGVGAGVEGYAAVAAAAREVVAEVDEARLVQVDMLKPGDGLALPPATARELARTVEALHRVFPDSGEDEVAGFRDAFAARYEDREVPLAIALDEDLGIGFGGSGGVAVEGAPLLGGLRGLTDGAEGALPWRARDAYLLDRLRGTGDELRLTDADLDALATRPRPLPRALAAMATVLDGDPYMLLFRGSVGPSGAQMLGRFSHLDPAVETLVREQVAAEEAAEPDAVFAEIVHLPEGRIGNIIARPVLRSYEIPFLGASGAPIDAQLPIDDLLVSVRGGRVVLRSRRLGREVLPRLTNAHFTKKAALAVYRFLAALQPQGRVQHVRWHWGPLSSAAYLPRIVIGSVVVERASWRVDPAELAPVASGGTAFARYDAVQRLRDARGLPRWVVLAEGDNELPVDLGTVAGTELFAHAARRGASMRLVERLPGRLAVRGPEGAYANEVVVPMVTDAPPVARPVAAVTREREGFAESFVPGSEWLYAKLYTGRTTADMVLREVVAPLVARAREEGAADGWFFLRYADPDQHVRVRLHGDASRLVPLLGEATEPRVADGLLSRVVLDTYRRETARYGGPEGVVLSEALFAADSDTALAALRVLDGDAAADDRWRFALAGLDRLYADLGVDVAERRDVVRGWRDDLVREFGDTGVAAKRLGGRLFRTERAVLAPLLDGTAGSPRLRVALPLLDARSAAIAPVAEALRAHEAAGRLSEPVQRLAVSYGHMWLIRMLRGAQRVQELVLCDLLDRVYAARAGRA